MNHSFIDKYSDRASVIHALDPRTKILATLAFVCAVVLLPAWQPLRMAGYGTLIFLVLACSAVPAGYVLARSLVVVPFVLFTAAFMLLARAGAAGAGGHVLFLGLKAWLAALALILLSSTTRFPELLKGLERMRVPRVFILLLSFMYRYVFVLLDEAMAMQRARDCRYFGGRYLFQVRVLGRIVASLFIRSYERGERVFKSMLSRGFDGELRTLSHLRFGKNDLVFSCLFGGILAVLGAVAR